MYSIHKILACYKAQNVFSHPCHYIVDVVPAFKKLALQRPFCASLIVLTQKPKTYYVSTNLKGQLSIVC